jgi:hypothetical protein
VNNLQVRTLRFAEEAVELAQSLDISRDQMHKLIDIVYMRPRGLPAQEMGGAIMTLIILNRLVTSRTIDKILKEEIHRVLSYPTEHFSKRNKEKIQLGLGSDNAKA